MKNKKILCSVCFLFAFVSVLWGQNITVKGNVTSKTDGQPIIGASVVQNDSKSTGTITDLDGNFTISVPKNASLAISYIGYKEVIIAAKPSLKIVMEEDSKMIDEVVVTGYMAEKKASLTGSVAVVKMKEVADIPTGNVMSGLQGRVAGMNVTTDGKPGGGNTDTKLRGITTINNSSPLYVIDGIQTHDNVASIISSNDVESIQVLKDAASAAIYGAQAANGVIIITTKRAKEGDVKVSFDMSLTAQTFAGGVDMLDAYQWGDVYWQAYKNTYGTHPNSVVYGNGEKAQLQEYYFDQNGVKIKSGNTDWAKEIFGTALMQNYNLSLSKGFKDGNVALTINYMNQDGLCRNTDYERFNSRLASNFRFVDGKVRVGESISVNHWLEHLNPSGIEELVIAQHPAIPVYDENGGYAGGYVDILGDKPNAIRLTDNEADNRHKSWRIFGSAYLEVEPIKNLVLKSQFGLNYTTGFNSTFVPKWSEADRKVDINELTVRQDNSVQWVWSNTANYSIELGKNNISAVIGTEAKKENGEHLQGYGRGLVIEDLDYRYLDTVTEGKSVSNNASTYAMVSYFGKVNYAFDDKYLISGTVRRDASSRFGKGNNSAIFPSVSAGWRVSREKFMERTQSWLSDLKLRASWGINGNDQIDNNATYHLEPFKTQFLGFTDTLFYSIHRTYLSRQSDFSRHANFRLNGCIHIGRKDCTDNRQIDSRIIHFQSSGNIQEHIFLCQLKSHPLFENSQQHIHSSQIETGCRTLRISVDCRAYQSLCLNQKWANPLNGGGNGYPAHPFMILT